MRNQIHSHSAATRISTLKMQIGLTSGQGYKEKQMTETSIIHITNTSECHN